MNEQGRISDKKTRAINDKTVVIYTFILFYYDITSSYLAFGWATLLISIVLNTYTNA